MITVFSQTLGQPTAESISLAEGSTVGDLRTNLSIPSHYIAKVNGADVYDSHVLAPYNVVIWAEKVKGA